MEPIWDRKILRSRRSLAVVAGMKKTKDHAEPTKSRTLKKTKANTAGQDEYSFFSSCSVVNKHNARYFYI